MPPEINDGLTDSERDILAELDNEADDDLDDLRSVAAGDDADEDDDEDISKTIAKQVEADGGEGKDANAGTIKTDAEGAGAAKSDDEGTAKQSESKPLAPIYQAQAPDNLDQQLKDVMAERRAARKSYEEGELTEDQYDAKLDELDQRRDNINSIRIKAQVSAEMTQQQLQQSYTATVNTFMKDMTKAGINYRDPQNAEIAKYLDSRVRALASAETEESPEVWRRVLDEAHDLTVKRFGIKAAKAADPADKEVPGQKQKHKAAAESKDRKPDLDGIPPTIGRGPGAANEGAVDAEFSHLEGLSGIALEKAIAKLTPEQLDRYLP